jgi:putative tryptophan/tyrosine transport system ATP-binding protein
MIKITQLHKLFNTGKGNEVKALQDINLDIRDGEFLLIVGANGSGKSTLLNCVSGSLLPSSGSIVIDESDVSRLREHQRSKWVSRVFQNPLAGTAPDLSILENFRLAALRTSPKGLKIGINDAFKSQVKERIAQLEMGLENKIDEPMGALSGGQRQALTLLMAIMDKGRILLLDEPTSALDPRSADVVMRTANKLIAEHQLTAILITHSVKEAFTYGNRIIHLSEGKILRDLGGNEKATLQQSDIYTWFS